VNRLFRERPTSQTPLDNSSLVSIGDMIETSSVTFQKLTTQSMSGQGSNALFRSD
jgi:hypothetical protein